MQNKKLYLVSFLDKGPTYVVSENFTEAIKKFEGEKIQCITLIQDSILETNSDWYDALNIMDVKEVILKDEPKDPFLRLSRDFRNWQKHWDAHDNGTATKPDSVDDFLKYIKKTYNVESI